MNSSVFVLLILEAGFQKILPAYASFEPIVDSNPSFSIVGVPYLLRVNGDVVNAFDKLAIYLQEFEYAGRKIFSDTETAPIPSHKNAEYVVYFLHSERFRERSLNLIHQYRFLESKMRLKIPNRLLESFPENALCV